MITNLQSFCTAVAVAGLALTATPAHAKPGSCTDPTPMSTASRRSWRLPR